MKHLAVALVVLASLLVAVSSPAAANEPCPTAGGGIDLLGGGAQACNYVPGGDAPASGLTGVEIWHLWCGYLVDTGAVVSYKPGAYGDISYQGRLDAADVDRFRLDPTGEYGWYYVHCFHPDPGGNGVGARNFYTITPPVSLADLRAIAKARINIDPPAIRTNPSFVDRFSIVNAKTWLWVEGTYWTRLESGPETSGFVTVEVFAEPILMEWSFNDPDGSSDLCNDAGIPWSRGAPDTDCFVKFTKSSAGQTNDAFVGTTEVSWEFTWTLNGADQGPFDGLFVATDTFELQVGEIQAVES